MFVHLVVLELYNNFFTSVLEFQLKCGYSAIKCFKEHSPCNLRAEKKVNSPRELEKLIYWLIKIIGRDPFFCWT